MFKFLKKRKIQDNENVEMKQNFEKNEETSVNSESISENHESIFPSAKEILEMSEQTWKHVTAEEVLEKMKKESSRGYRYAKFFGAYISDELVKELRDKGYKVEVNTLLTSVGPHFEISW